MMKYRVPTFNAVARYEIACKGSLRCAKNHHPEKMREFAKDFINSSKCLELSYCERDEIRNATETGVKFCKDTIQRIMNQYAHIVTH